MISTMPNTRQQQPISNRNSEAIMIQKIKSHKGITLLELLVASVIAMICTGAALEVYVSQQKGWLAQENISDMQQNGRASIDELVFHIRQAGYSLPGDLEPISGANSNPDTISLVYLKEPVCDATLTEPMPKPSSELKSEPYTIDCFQTDTWAYIYDPSTDYGEFFFITWVQNASGHIQHNLADLSIAYPAGSVIYMIEVVTFYVDNTTDPNHPKLMLARVDGIPHIYADSGAWCGGGSIRIGE
jgi:type II secretory pathway pseudopilin PulG